MNAKQILSELEQELVATEKLVRVVPENQLKFRPHSKAMTLGQLALHVATIPHNNLEFAKDGKVEADVIVIHPEPISRIEILNGLEKSKITMRSLLDVSAENWLSCTWKLTSNGEVLAEMPTTSFIRTFVLNHWYHHRGQLSTYLRSLDITIPSIYGPSADVNPFC